jgi:4-hydroxy-2-oxoheptanedioate aldolase
MAYQFGALSERLRRPEPLYVGWCTTGHAWIAAELARDGFEAVCCDMQHGTHDEATAAASVAAIVAAGAAPMMRVPVDAGAMASYMLDSGAELIVAPMVNTAAEARRLVEFTKFPPLGKRSWGPTTAFNLYGIGDPATYLARANDAPLLAMIETQQAIDNLEEILSVDGVGGTFVGPSDLSIALSRGAHVAPSAPETHAAAKLIGDATRRHGKIAAILALTPDDARTARDSGFQVIILGTDFILLKEGARAFLDAMRS